MCVGLKNEPALNCIQMRISRKKRTERIPTYTIALLGREEAGENCKRTWINSLEAHKANDGHNGKEQEPIARSPQVDVPAKPVHMTLDH